ncbi:MAG: hypothetical protein ACI4A5_06305 [Hominilimicola sp.]
MKKTLLIILVCILLICVISTTIFFNCTQTGIAIRNNYWHGVKKVDDNTEYENRKHVEDTCRAMIASYKSDKLTYEQYKDSDNEEKQSWAEQAKMRANKTAASYNEYILKNSYIWDGNVPSDIDNHLDYLD